MIADSGSLRAAVEAVTSLDDDLDALFRRNGLPPLWRRPPGFATLVRFVLEQQVSLASARAAFERLSSRIGDVTPDPFLTLSDAELREVGFSRQKAGYVRGLARAIAAGEFDPDTLTGLGDDDARRELLDVRGIGPWTADCYLLFCLGREDAWPSGDRALQVALHRLRGLDEVPDAAATDIVAEGWRPWRAAAARLLWHDYLGGRDYRAPA